MDKDKLVELARRCEREIMHLSPQTTPQVLAEAAAALRSHAQPK